MLATIRDRLRQLFTDVSIEGVVAAADTVSTPAPVIPGKAKYTIFVQKIVIDLTVSTAATVKFQDSNGTPKVIYPATSPAIATTPTILDFGDDGIGLTEGKDLQMILSAAGLAFNWKVYAYLKPTSTRAITDI